jgi:hypothetical protein
MIDPISAIGLATAAFNTVKQAINAGKEVADMGKSLGQFASAMSDLDFAHAKAENPPMFKKIFGASQIEQNALEIWGHKQKAKEMREELRNYISTFYGPSAWKEIVAIEAKMRKQRREQEYAKIERQETIMAWIVGLITFLIGGGVLFFIIWLVTTGR